MTTKKLDSVEGSLGYLIGGGHTHTQSGDDFLQCLYHSGRDWIT